MTDHKGGRQPTKPTVSGVPVLPVAVHGIDSPHVELLARLCVGGGTLTTLETREICAAIVCYIETLRGSPQEAHARDRP